MADKSPQSSLTNFFKLFAGGEPQLFRRHLATEWALKNPKDATNPRIVPPFKAWKADVIRYGRDCSLWNFEYRLYQDGTTHLTGDVYSSDTGDEWDMQVLFSPTPNELDITMYIDPHYHYDISDKDTFKHWDEPRPASNTIVIVGTFPENYLTVEWLLLYIDC